MTKPCEYCGKELKFLHGEYHYLNGKEIFLCQECWIKERGKTEEQRREDEQRRQKEEEQRRHEEEEQRRHEEQRRYEEEEQRRRKEEQRMHEGGKDMNQSKKIVSMSQRFGLAGGLAIIIGIIAYFFAFDLMKTLSYSNIQMGNLLINLSYILIVFGFVFITIAGVMRFLESKSIPNQNPNRKFCSGCGNEVKSNDAYCPKCGKKL